MYYRAKGMIDNSLLFAAGGAVSPPAGPGHGPGGEALGRS